MLLFAMGGCPFSGMYQLSVDFSFLFLLLQIYSSIHCMSKKALFEYCDLVGLKCYDCNVRTEVQGNYS